MSRKENEHPLRRYAWIIHCLFWLFMFSFPFIFTSRSSEETFVWDWYLRFCITLTSTVAVFYANYSYLVRRFLFRKQTLLFIGANLLLIVGVSYLVHWTMEALPPFGTPQPPHHEHGAPPEDINLRLLIGNIMRLSFTVAISVALRVTTGWYTVDAQRRELETSRAEAELQNLKSQLNPHFLFNTLNNLYSLIAISQEQAQAVVHELSRLLRYVLYDSSQPYVAVEKELDFIHNYVELMRIRLSHQVDISVKISACPPKATIAPLLFISLIENAFKHGVSNSKPSFIGIDIHQKGNELVCVILNSYFPKDAETDKSGSGIGLPNLQKRLDLLYPGKYELQCGREGEHYRAYLAIKIEER